MIPLKRKLVSKKGFSFAELLVTAVIMLLVCLAVTVGVSTAATVQRNVTMSSEASALCGTIAVELTDVLRFARNINGTTAPVFDSPRFGTSVSVGTDAQVAGQAGYITVGGPTEEHLVLPEKSYTNNLKALVDVSYASGTGFALTITVVNSEGETLETAAITVKPLSA